MATEPRDELKKKSSAPARPAGQVPAPWKPMDDDAPPLPSASKSGKSFPAGAAGQYDQASAPPIQTATWGDFPDRPPVQAMPVYGMPKENFEIGAAGDDDGCYIGSGSTAYAPLMDPRGDDMHSSSTDVGITSDPTRGDPTSGEIRRGNKNAAKMEMQWEVNGASSEVRARQEVRKEKDAFQKAKATAKESARKGFEVSDPHAHLMASGANGLGKPRSKTEEIVLGEDGEAKTEDDDGNFKIASSYTVAEYNTEGSSYSVSEYKSIYD